MGKIRPRVSFNLSVFTSSLTSLTLSSTAPWAGTSHDLVKSRNYSLNLFLSIHYDQLAGNWYLNPVFITQYERLN